MSKKRRIRDLEHEVAVMRRAIVDLVREVWRLREQQVAAVGLEDPLPEYEALS